jgi:hypothetical protein
MTITHDDDNKHILVGPMGREDYLIALKNKTGLSKIEFIDRSKSKNVINEYSKLGEGYIIMKLGDFCPVLYDSVRNPVAYMSATEDWGITIGRHNGQGDFFLVEVYWEGINKVVNEHYRGGPF